MVTSRRWVKIGLAVGVLSAAGYFIRQHFRRVYCKPREIPPSQARRWLERAAPLIRLPTSPNSVPEVLPDGSGLVCPITGRVYPFRNGVLDLLDDATPETGKLGQRILDTAFTSWGYDSFRSWLSYMLGTLSFDEEVAYIQQSLQAQAGDTIFDMACGHGNFTVELAKRIGSDGLIIGLDISHVMLARAAYHAERWGMDNILLIRGDAHHLPFVNNCFQKVNCSGGFHQFPNLPQALSEIARVSAEGAILTASAFAEAPYDPFTVTKRFVNRHFGLHFVPLICLGQQLEVLSFTDYHWRLTGGRFAYLSARKKTCFEPEANPDRVY